MKVLQFYFRITNSSEAHSPLYWWTYREWACRWNFVCFLQFLSTSKLIVLKCVQMKFTIISALLVAYQFFRRWILWMCGQGFLVGIRNIYIHFKWVIFFACPILLIYFEDNSRSRRRFSMLSVILRDSRATWMYLMMDEQNIKTSSDKRVATFSIIMSSRNF